MKVINPKGFKEIPVAARIVYGIAFVCAIIAIVTIMLDVFEICTIEKCVSIAFASVSMMLNNIVLSKHRDKLYKEI